MARTAQMRLIEHLVLKQDISNVIAFLGKTGNFQFQSLIYNTDNSSSGNSNDEHELFSKLDQARVFLGTADFTDDILNVFLPTEKDEKKRKIIEGVAELSRISTEKNEMQNVQLKR